MTSKEKATRFPYSQLHVVAALGILCFGYGLLVEPKLLFVSKFELRSTKLSGPIRVVQISDLHCEAYPRVEEWLARTVNALDPDLIFFTGDAVNTSEGIPFFKEALRSLEARAGKFAIQGNWDRLYGPEELFANTGFQWLGAKSTVARIGSDAVHISGGDYGDDTTARNRVSEAPIGLFRNFLFHTPDLVEDFADRGPDLYLAGHTHGGQVRLPFFGALVTLSRFGKKYEMGGYDVGPTHLHVSRGIGLEPRPAPQVRFLCPPEVVFYETKPSSGVERQ